MNTKLYKKSGHRERLILTFVVKKWSTVAETSTVFCVQKFKPTIMKQQPREYLRLALAVSFLVSAAAGEDKWVWSRDRRGDDSPGDRKYPGGTSRTGRFDDEIRPRYDVTEPTTRRPGSSKPQADEFSDDFPSESPRYNFNAFGRPGPPPGFGPSGPSPGNLYPNPQNGILVGPGGPTGIIGRPPLGGPPINRQPHPLKGNPANGILVGPGGPTGIIGRPPHFGGPGIGPGPGINNNLGPQVFPTAPGNPQFYPRPGAGQYPGPSGYPTGGIFPGGGFPPSPGAYPGGYPTGAGFLPGPGQSFYPGRGPEGNYYLSNFSPFRSRSNSAAFDEIDGRSAGKSSENDRGLNRNILKKSVR